MISGERGVVGVCRAFERSEPRRGQEGRYSDLLLPWIPGELETIAAGFSKHHVHLRPSARRLGRKPDHHAWPGGDTAVQLIEGLAVWNPEREMMKSRCWSDV